MAETLDQHEEIKEPPLTSMLFKDALLLLAALSIWAAAYSWFEFLFLVYFLFWGLMGILGQ